MTLKMYQKERTEIELSNLYICPSCTVVYATSEAEGDCKVCGHEGDFHKLVNSP